MAVMRAILTASEVEAMLRAGQTVPADARLTPSARDLVEDQLRYADLIGLPVWLAVETQPLPFEEHVRLEHVTRRGLATAYLDRAGKRLVFTPPSGGDEQDWFRIVQRTTVRPERLTFSGRPRRDVDAMIRRLDQTLPNRSFSGVLIHDYPGFLALPAIKEDP